MQNCKKLFKNIPKKLKGKTEKQQQRIKLNRGGKSKCKSLLRWKSFVPWQIIERFLISLVLREQEHPGIQQFDPDVISPTAYTCTYSFSHRKSLAFTELLKY